MYYHLRDGTTCIEFNSRFPKSPQFTVCALYVSAMTLYDIIQAFSRFNRQADKLIKCPKQSIFLVQVSGEYLVVKKYIYLVNNNMKLKKSVKQIMLITNCK